MNTSKVAISEKKIIAILMLCGLFIVSQVYLLIPLITLLQKYFAVSRNNVLWVISAFGFAYASGFLVLGPLSDRFGRKKLMITGLASLSIITLVIGFVHSFEMLIVLRILQGFAASTFAPTAMAYMGELVSENLRAIGLSLLIMAFALSGIFGQVYASMVTEVSSWHWVFWILAFIYMLMLFFIMSSLKDMMKTPSSIIDLYKGMLLHLRNPILLPLYFTTFIILMSFVAVYSVLESYLHQRFGLSPEKIVYIRMAGIPSMCLSPIAGYFVRRVGGSRIATLGLIILIFGLLCESLSTSLVQFTLSSALFDAGIAITTPGIVIMVNKVTQHAKASAMSLYTFFLFIGAALGPLVDEQLYKLGFSGICYTFMVLFVICIGMLFLITQRLQIRSEIQG